MFIYFYYSALALQDLLDMENVDEIEWWSGSETEDDAADDHVVVN